MNNANMKAEGLSEMLPSREKYWGEIDDKTKVERMRNIVQGLLERVESQEKIINRLRVHKHNKEEKVVTEEPMEFGNHGMEIRQVYRRFDKNKDEVYF